MSKVLEFPKMNEWNFDSIEGCQVMVTREDKPLTVEAVNYLLDMAKLDLLSSCREEDDA